MKFKKPYVIIAAHNEEKHIQDVIKSVQKFCKNIIIANDGSTDNTRILAEKTSATVLTHVINLGKGAAMKTGAQYAIKQGADALIFIDGDGQHDPAEIPKFLKALEKTDVVIGARRFNKNMPFVRKLGKLLTQVITKIFYGIDITDCLNGYRAVRVSAYPKIEWSATDYTVEVEMIAWIGKEKLKYKEVTTKTIYHDAHKGVTPMHGFAIIWNLIMWRFQGRKE